MKWIKRGLIYRTDERDGRARGYASVPTADEVVDGRLRIYFGPRDSSGRTFTTFIDVEAANPANVLYVHDRPVLEPGKLGTFDDSGVMPSCIVNHEGRKYLYYIGWNRGVSVPYRNSIGVALSDDGGVTFRRMFDGPVADRTHLEPYFCASHHVMIEDDLWKLWYASCTGWTLVEGKPEPAYQIKYAESRDGVEWIRNNTTCIEYKFAGEANARPSVLREDGRYRMWYCYRGSLGYRTNVEQSYRMGYAESGDGIRWTRMDEQVGIERSVEGWDSEMIEYPCVYEHEGRKYMLYNGNGFGATGFGYAVLETE